MERNELLKRLHALLGSMDLPGHKKTPVTNESLRWLGRCLAQRNAKHPKFEEAVEILRQLGVDQIALPA